MQETKENQAGTPKKPAVATEKPKGPKKNEETPTKAETKKEEKERRKAEYLKLKENILEYEKTNLKAVILIRKEGDSWWKTIGHSTIILKEHVGQMVKKNYNVHKDTDYGPQSEEGVISVPAINEFTNDMKTVRIYCKKRTETAAFFLLEEPLTQEQYDYYRGLEEKMIEMTNKMIIPEIMMPDLHEEIKNLQHKVRTFIDSRVSKTVRESYGYDFERIVIGLSRNYLKMEGGRFTAKEFLDGALDTIKDIEEYLLVFLDERPPKAREIYKMADSTMRVKAEITKARKREACRQIDKEATKGKVINGTGKKPKQGVENGA